MYGGWQCGKRRGTAQIKTVVGQHVVSGVDYITAESHGWSVKQAMGNKRGFSDISSVFVASSVRLSILGVFPFVGGYPTTPPLCTTLLLLISVDTRRNAISVTSCILRLLWDNGAALLSSSAVNGVWVGGYGTFATMGVIQSVLGWTGERSEEGEYRAAPAGLGGCRRDGNVGMPAL
nr:LOW QUALITY PROTEIN: hypothetical protein L203_00661 [Cryptococcus depauperatus CBS 7841]